MYDRVADRIHNQRETAAIADMADLEGTTDPRTRETGQP